MKTKMKNKLKVLLVEAVKAAVAAFIGAITAAMSGCTTINIPADDARPSSFNGITTFRVNQ